MKGFCVAIYAYRAASDIELADVTRLRDYIFNRELAQLVGLWLEPPGDWPLLERPGFRHLGARLKRGDVLVVPRLEQLAVRESELRELGTWLNRHAVTLRLVEDRAVIQPEGAFFPQLTTVFVSARRRWFGERVRLAMTRKEAQPGSIVHRPEYGCRIVERDGRRRVEACSWERRWISTGVAMRKAGQSFAAITEDFRKRRAKTAQGKAWNYWRVRRAVLNQLAKDARQVGPLGQGGNAAAEAVEPLCKSSEDLTPDEHKLSGDGPFDFVIEGVNVRVFKQPAKSLAQVDLEAKVLLRVLREMLGQAPAARRRRKWKHERRMW